MKASHKAFKAIIGYQKVDIQHGQFIFGRNKASEETPLSPKQIRNCVSYLARIGNLTIKSANKYSIITITNWDTYQPKNNDRGQQDFLYADEIRGQQSGQQMGQQDLDNNYNKLKYLSAQEKQEGPAKRPANGPAKGQQYIINKNVKEVINPPSPPKGECLSNFQNTKKKRISELSSEQQKSFARFWSVWPKRVAMADAEKAWAKIDISNGMVEEICNAVARWSQTDDWKKENGKYIPYPATWLNAKRWRDEIKVVNNQPEYSYPVITAGDNSIFIDPEKT